MPQTQPIYLLSDYFLSDPICASDGRSNRDNPTRQNSMLGLCPARDGMADQVAARRAMVRNHREDLITTVASVRDSFPKGGMLLYIWPPPPLTPLSLPPSPFADPDAILLRFTTIG